MDRAQTLRVHYNLSYEFAYLYPSPLDQKAPLLESLELKQVGIPWGHDPEPLKLPDALFRNHAPRLAHLTLHRCRWPRQWASLPQLRSLTMAWCGNTAPAVFINAIRGMPLLERIIARHCMSWREAPYSNVPRKPDAPAVLPNLMHLEIAQFGTEDLFLLRHIKPGRPLHHLFIEDFHGQDYGEEDERGHLEDILREPTMVQYPSGAESSGQVRSLYIEENEQGSLRAAGFAFETVPVVGWHSLKKTFFMEWSDDHEGHLPLVDILKALSRLPLRAMAIVSQRNKLEVEDWYHALLEHSATLYELEVGGPIAWSLLAALGTRNIGDDEDGQWLLPGLKVLLGDEDEKFVSLLEHTRDHLATRAAAGKELQLSVLDVRRCRGFSSKAGKSLRKTNCAKEVKWDGKTGFRVQPLREDCPCARCSEYGWEENEATSDEPTTEEELEEEEWPNE